MVFASRPLAQQIAMAKTVGTVVWSHNVAARIDPKSKGVCSAWDIKRGELVSAQQKAMAPTIDLREIPDDVAARGDPIGFGEGRARDLNRRELTLISRKP
jgi:hypothetical protein